MDIELGNHVNVLTIKSLRDSEVEEGHVQLLRP